MDHVSPQAMVSTRLAQASGGPPPASGALPVPSRSYIRAAWRAVTVLVLFCLAYLALGGWFAWTAWRYYEGIDVEGIAQPMRFLEAVMAATMAFMMFKGLLFVRQALPAGKRMEVSVSDQPDLFAYLHALADAVGAPRVHRVFLSDRASAGVFYDISPLNLIFPSKKNLEIGLPLINLLNLGELRAVLAHEFGHFAQRTMAVGRWLYIAQQIVAKLLDRRDRFDRFLMRLSRTDVRIAWLGWIIQSIAWSVRTLTALAFRQVLALQRGLLLEMEMQADLVAVALTGSDALVHALYKLKAIEESWIQTLIIAKEEARLGRPPADLFALQARVCLRMGEAQGDPQFGQTPASAGAGGPSHRVFDPDLAHPATMWRTHPAHHEREENAKREYRASEMDPSASWSLLVQPESLRQRMSAHILDLSTVSRLPLETSLERVDVAFRWLKYAHRFRGAHFGRSIVRCASRSEQLYGDEDMTLEHLEGLYPLEQVRQLARLRRRELDLDMLKAARGGPGAAMAVDVNYRGRRLSAKDLPTEIDRIKTEMQALRRDVEADDRCCRRIHLRAAQTVGRGWEPYLRGLLSLLHYADHSEANLRDLWGLVGYRMREIGQRGTSGPRVEALLQACHEFQVALHRLVMARGQVHLDAALRARTGKNWAQMLGEVTLPQATRRNIQAWMKLAQARCQEVLGQCACLRELALEALLSAEAALADHLRGSQALIDAPTPSTVPADYDVLLLGEERAWEPRLSLTERIVRAQPRLVQTAQIMVSAALLSTIVYLACGTFRAEVTVYNGLGRPVQVQIGAGELTVPAHAARLMKIDGQRPIRVHARTLSGAAIDAFEGQDPSESGLHAVYNVVSASPLITGAMAALSNPAGQILQSVGAPRWYLTAADFVMPLSRSDAPSAATERNGMLIEGMSLARPSAQIQALSSLGPQRHDLIMAHLRWDPTNAPGWALWLAKARPDDIRQTLDVRLQESPQDVYLLLLRQVLSPSAAQLAPYCDEHRRQAHLHPGDPDLVFLNTHCALMLGQGSVDALTQALRLWPDHPWLNLEVGYLDAMRGDRRAAVAKLTVAMNGLPALAPGLERKIGRCKHLPQGPTARHRLVAPRWCPMAALGQDCGD